VFRGDYKPKLEKKNKNPKFSYKSMFKKYKTLTFNFRAIKCFLRIEKAKL
jgi:hypothetical protein